MAHTITISPLSRIEGHASIAIHLDTDGRVESARLHVREFRGFEACCVGRPFWEMPAIAARICGICPASHAMAAAMAGDMILGVTVPPAARLLRSLLSLAQLVLSHSLSFFHLSSPDILLGLDSPPAERNIAGLARRFPDVIRKGIRLRQIGQEIVNRIGGGHLHPEYIVPGGMLQPLSVEDRDALSALMPEALGLVRFALDVWHEHGEHFSEEMGDCCGFPSLYLGLVGEDGCLDHAAGKLRFVDTTGASVRELPPTAYAEAIRETLSGDSYMKPTEYVFPVPPGPPVSWIQAMEREPPIYRVGPLARINVAPFRQAPLASRERDLLLEGGATEDDSLSYHHARLIEMLYSVERVTALLDDPDLTDSNVLVRAEVHRREGVGVTEAPRGTLIHHYRVDQHGLLTGINLVVATGHNSRAMDRTITDIARHHLRGNRLNEGLLNRVEHGIRLYDPCLSCATHAVGRLGMTVELYSPEGMVIDSSTI